VSESFFAGKPVPPAAAFLGWELLSESPEEGRIEIAFQADERMLNPRGNVQGGFVAAMLDDTMGPALVSMSGGTVMPSSIDLSVSFIRPMRPGRIIGRGRVVKQGRSVVFLEGELFDAAGNLLARGTSSALPVEIA
jgi:uncharacterized protein (TIGR00369 family)